MRTRPLRSALLAALRIVGAGFAVNGAVVLYLCYITPSLLITLPDNPPVTWYDSGSDTTWALFQSDTHGLTRIRADFMGRGRTGGYYGQGATEDAIERVPHWSAARTPGRFRMLHSVLQMREYAVGWPLRSAHGSTLYLDSTTAQTKDSFQNIGALSFDGRQAFVTPSLTLLYHPIWVGMLANTIVYAFALSLLTLTVVHFRRRMYLRQGLCPSCRYPQGRSPRCSECGYLFRS